MVVVDDGGGGGGEGGEVRPTSLNEDEFYTDGQAWSGDFWSGRAWRSHFKDGLTMLVGLVGCAATPVGRQSCTNWPGICQIIAPCPEIDRSLADYRPIITLWSDDCRGHRPISQLTWRCRPMPGRSPMFGQASPDYLSMFLRLKKKKEKKKMGRAS